MSTANCPSDRRGSFRCPVADSRMGCVLQVGAKRVPGRLLNESAGGFSVLVGGPLDLGVDQTAELHSDSGWFEVQVAHVMEASPPEGGDAKSSEEEPGPWFRLGLRRCARFLRTSRRYRFSPRTAALGCDRRAH